MWFLVHAVRGSKYFEPESPVGNRVLVSDTSDMVIQARAMGTDGYRFEARKGNETFVVTDFTGAQAAETLANKFTLLARQMDALVIATE